MYDPKKEFPKGKKGKFLKIDRKIDYQIECACERHRLNYIDIVEQGAGNLARGLLKQKPLTGMGT